MIEFDEIEGIEQARQAEEDEERKRREEAAYLARVFELEALVEERLQRTEDDSAEGTPGVLITIPLKDFEYLKKWKEVTNIFFCDAMNASLQKLRKLLAKKDRCIEVGAEAYEGMFDTIFAFINIVVQLRFFDKAVACCEELADAFQAERGCCALVSQILDSANLERRRNEARRSLMSVLKRIVFLLLRLLLHAHLKWEQREFFARFWTETHLAVLPGVVQMLFVTIWLEHGWEVKSEDVLELSIRLEETWEERQMLVSKRWRLEDLHHALQSLLCESAQLLLVQEGSDELEEPDLHVPFESVRQPLVLRGVSPEHPGWQALEQSPWPPEWVQRWRTYINRICKTTPHSATRLLAELRSSFTSRQFQDQYRTLKRESRPGNKAHQEILSLTFNVQSEVLPRYGFEPTPKGLMEMRDEMPLFAGRDIWAYYPEDLMDHIADQVVWKVRRDIHSVLDMGQVLPRMQLSGNESMGHNSWLRWAQLNATMESNCDKAAQLIAEADFFVLCAGAGFSADSGLAVYADVARVGPYAQRGLDYSDICNQKWLRKEPEFFWGFWGQCYNDYRNTPPHEGYSIIHRWVERRFRSSAWAQSVRQRLAEVEVSEQGIAVAANLPPPEKLPYVVKDHAGAFHAYTSNVDAHLWDWFLASEIRECHGNTETFQCASQDGRCEGQWRAPFEYCFRVQKSTMLAPAGPPGEATDGHDPMGSEGEEAAPHVGFVRGGGRPDALRHMPDPLVLSHKGFRTNHPKCPHCGAPARPSILMFKDSDFRDNRPQAARWEAWVSAAKHVIQSRLREGSSAPRVTVLEVGAGGNVTTVRKTSESLILGFLEAGAEAHLVRVNPELPLGDGERFAPNGDLEHRVVSIMGCALESIRRMDAAMPEVLRG